jgi:hypothetical protein
MFTCCSALCVFLIVVGTDVTSALTFVIFGVSLKCPHRCLVAILPTNKKIIFTCITCCNFSVSGDFYTVDVNCSIFMDGVKIITYIFACHFVSVVKYG